MADSQKADFQKLADQFTKFLLRTSPVTASYVGVHDYDEELASYTPAAIKAKVQKLAAFRSQFKALTRRKQEPDDAVDLELALGHIETETLLATKHPLHALLPDLYLNEILFGVYALISRNFADERTRALSATRRLVQAESMLQQAQKNLKNVPQVFVESGMHTCIGAIAFLKDAVPEFARDVRGSLKDALLEANQEAIAVLDGFGRYLQDKLLPTAKDNFSIGAPLYNQLLKIHHHLDYSHGDLLRIARKTIKDTEEALAKTAAQLSKGQSWKQLVEKLKKEHPTTQGLLGAYKKEMLAARAFIKENELITIPEGETLEVVPTPAFARPLIPYVTYISPAPLDAEQKGLFWVTVPFGLPQKEAAERLKGHSKWRIPTMALHEGYPGRHLQSVRANRSGRLLRHLVSTSVFSEGWAFYCEEMMAAAGCQSHPKERLLQLRDTLFRAYRVVIDVGLHTKTIKFSAAVNLLVEQVGVGAANAEAEVRRYCQMPTQPMSYLIGHMEIKKLLADYKRKKGGNFLLRQFHDDLLAHGTIPLSMIRQLMGL
ncbi:MAG: DUF885 domain-containing protein [Myxococcales bacterium]|nr:MAG: DUF885 domain-containing protein [Myxococcales bacterium]